MSADVIPIFNGCEICGSEDATLRDISTVPFTVASEHPLLSNVNVRKITKVRLCDGCFDLMEDE